jgi:uncharacterized membrane protein YdjX (TVP38/TMEM64 family)
VKASLAQLLAWVQAIGPWGPPAWALVYAAASTAWVPGSLLSMAAGFAFGLPLGCLTVVVGSNTGATIAFLLGRTLARGWVERRIAPSVRFRKFDRVFGTHGFQIVLLLRLSPLFPFAVLNYGLSLTQVSYRAFALATLLGMLPGIVLYVYLGSLVKSIAELVAGQAERTPEQEVLFVAGLVATAVATALVTRAARRALSEPEG